MICVPSEEIVAVPVTTTVEELTELLDAEIEQQMKCFYSEDCSEGIRAFFEKRLPKFHGK